MQGKYSVQYGYTDKKLVYLQQTENDDLYDKVRATFYEIT